MYGGIQEREEETVVSQLVAGCFDDDDHQHYQAVQPDITECTEI